MLCATCSGVVRQEFWIGRIGDLSLIRPGPGYSRDSNDHATMHDLLDGQMVQRSLHNYRIWQVSIQYMTQAEVSLLEEYRTRQRGPGPHVFIDPHTVNYLWPNQASGTDAVMSTEGFTITGTGETLASSTTVSYTGVRSLAWTLSPPVTGSGGVMHLVPPDGRFGWATPPVTGLGQPWAFSAWVRSGGTDATMTIYPRLRWMNTAGSGIGGVNGSAIVTNASTWQQLIVTGYAPTGSTITQLNPCLIVSGASVTGSGIVYADRMQLEMCSAVSDWRYGQGQPLVSIIQDGETVVRVARMTTLGYQFVELST